MNLPEEQEVVFIIPCLNESETINRVLREIRSHFLNPRVIVIDNDSDDDTAIIAKANGAEVYFQPKRGKGNAFRTGLEKMGRGNYVVMIDGDFTYDLANLTYALGEVYTNHYDMAVGNRRPVVDQGSVSRFGHRTFNLIFSYFFKIVFRVNISDSLSGFRIMRKSFLEVIDFNVRGFELETLLNYHAAINNSKILNFNCDYRKRPIGSFSKLNSMKDAYKIMRLVFSLLVDYRAGQIFGLLSLIFFILYVNSLIIANSSLELLIISIQFALSGSIIKRLTYLKNR